MKRLKIQGKKYDINTSSFTSLEPKKRKKISIHKVEVGGFNPDLHNINSSKYGSIIPKFRGEIKHI